MGSILGRSLLMIGGATAVGVAMDCLRQCSSGTRPLTSTWWREALSGAFLGLIVALGSRSH
jgi:hypothetical protein